MWFRDREVISTKRSLKPQELMRSQGGVGRGAGSLCSFRREFTEGSSGGLQGTHEVGTTLKKVIYIYLEYCLNTK